MPQPRIEWFKDAVPLSKLANPRYKVNTTTGLTVRRVQPGDGGTFQCLARNAAGEAQAYTQLLVSSEFVWHTCNKLHLQQWWIYSGFFFFFEGLIVDQLPDFWLTCLFLQRCGTTSALNCCPPKYCIHLAHHFHASQEQDPEILGLIGPGLQLTPNLKGEILSNNYINIICH